MLRTRVLIHDLVSNNLLGQVSPVNFTFATLNKALLVVSEQEDLLREMGVQAGKPTPEVALLRQQIDQLQSRHRTEIALNDHEKLQLQQRLEDEVSAC